MVRIVDGVSVALERPGITMLLGPSGCGKSTILRMLGGVRPIGVKTPTEGEVLINGVRCDGPHNDAVMVFQRYANRPDLTVRDNVALPFRFALWKNKVPEAEQKQRIDQILEAVGLADGALSISGYGQLWIIDVVGDGTAVVEESTFGLVDD